MTLPIIPTIKALYANAETSTLLRQRDTYLKQVLHLVYTASHTKTYSDFSDSRVHCMHHDFSKINKILLLHFQQMVLNLL
jgi:hypothetical protein